MIFKNLEEIKNLSLDEKIAKIGTIKKAPYNKKLFISNMMLNPLKLEHLNNIDNLKANMITLNLEDAIAPNRKKEALINIALFLSHCKYSNSFIIVRTNPIDDGGEEEIKFLNQFSFDAIRIAKIKTKDNIKKALDILSYDKELHISLETKEAFINLSSLKFDNRFTTANLGILDLLNSLGLPQSILKLNNPTIDYILSKFLVDSKALGIRPISFMYQDYNDTITFEKWCQKEKLMGFESKACMGPAQVDIANNVFTNDDELKKARYIKEIFEKNSKNNVNGFMDSYYGFIDEPIYKDALLILGLQD
jgi:citrate lyase subunit beta/citryl-CoA lyase